MLVVIAGANRKQRMVFDGVPNGYTSDETEAVLGDLGFLWCSCRLT